MRKHMPKRFEIWIIAVLIMTAVLLLTFLMISTKWMPVMTRSTALGVGILVTFLIVVFWTRKCIRQVGTPELPTQAVLARFARPVDAVGLGLLFVIWPIEALKEFPTGQYVMNYRIAEGLYSKKGKDEKGRDLSSLSMIVEASIYFRFPRTDRIYSFPMPIEKAKETLEEGGKLDSEGLREGLAWGRTSGKELLMRTYYRLPIRNPKEGGSEDKLHKFFEGAVEGGLRHVMGAKTFIECKEEKPMIEEEVKNYLLSAEGDPFFECGIPKECLNLELKDVRFPEDIEQAWRAPEIAIREGEAAIEKAIRKAEAAKSERERIKEITKGYIDAGVSPNVAGLLTGGVEGKAMSFEQLRDLAIFKAIGGLK